MPKWGKKRAEKLASGAAERRKFAADVSASDLRRAAAYFRKRFDGRDDGDQCGEAMSFLWPEYCAARGRGKPHDDAMRLACKVAVGRVKRGSRFASTVQCGYVDSTNTADWRRRAELDAERSLLLACGEDIRPEFQPPPPRNPPVEVRVPRRPHRVRRSYRPLSVEPQTVRAPAAVGRQYGKARFAGGEYLGGLRFNLCRIEERLERGEWLFAYLPRD